MAQGAVEFQRQQSFGDLEQLLSKERPFEGGKRRHERRLSDPQLDEIDDFLFKDFSRNVFFRRTSADFHYRKMKFLKRLGIQSFHYELVMKSVRDRQKTEKERVQELSELSNYIASAQVVIDEFQSRYSKSYESTERLETEQVKFRSTLEMIEENIKKTKIKAKFETNEDDLRQFFSDPSRICYALGLSVDFLRWFNFESFPDDIQNHIPIEHWICNFLRQRYKKTMQDVEQSFLSEAEVLESIGFRPNSTSSKTIRFRTSQLQAHLTLIDSVELFIKDEFKYNFVLSEVLCSRFPYSLPQLNKWFLRPQAQENEEGNQSYYIINLENPKEFEPKLSQLPSENSSQTILFHGTDHESALDILSQGIDINIGCKKRDFSDGAGFYLTNDLENSIRLAFGKTSRPAVLVYRVSEETLSSFSRLSLCSEEKIAEWEAVVSMFRSGRRYEKLCKSLEKIDFIEGPVASSYKIPPVPKEGSYQMCVISDDLAEEFDSCVRAVAFFDGSTTECGSF